MVAVALYSAHRAAQCIGHEISSERRGVRQRHLSLARGCDLVGLLSSHRHVSSRQWQERLVGPGVGVHGYVVRCCYWCCCCCCNLFFIFYCFLKQKTMFSLNFFLVRWLIMILRNLEIFGYNHMKLMLWLGTIFKNEPKQKKKQKTKQTKQSYN